MLPHLISWMLIHSLWIALLCWALTRVLNSICNRSITRKKIRIGVFFLFLFSLVGALSGTDTNQAQEAIWLISSSNVLVPETDHWLKTAYLWVNENSLLISLVWLVGMTVALLRFWKSHRLLKRYQAGTVSCTDQSLLNRLHNQAKQLRISKKVELRLSALINSPMTTGFLKPIIYLPLGLASGLSEKELDTIIQHELAHIRHHDYLVNYGLVALETLFFFNPMVLLMVKELRQEMEYACDDLVTRYESPITYSRALIKLQELSLSNSVALAANQKESELKKRINRMINSNNKNRSPRLAMITILLAMSILSTAFIGKEAEAEPIPEPVIEKIVSLPQEQTKQDTLRFMNNKELMEKLKELGFDGTQGHIFMVNGKEIKVIRAADNALKKADEMMVEIREELINDGLLREDRPKMTLMFQYSDLLNGKANLGGHYEKYKAIFNRYFPKYDSFATTRIFRYKKS